MWILSVLPRATSVPVARHQFVDPVRCVASCVATYWFEEEVHIWPDEALFSAVKGEARVVTPIIFVQTDLSGNKIRRCWHLVLTAAWQVCLPQHSKLSLQWKYFPSSLLWSQRQSHKVGHSLVPECRLWRSLVCFVREGFGWNIRPKNSSGISCPRALGGKSLKWDSFLLKHIIISAFPA